ncbi:hypothetical protein KJY77_03820 [Canibacter sp. lx-72]|uniref:hypothetical protein n=1 Tax=Canibacter zhuwentaonis TaxID=2837491 RepID=UPI001BDC6E5C|nr:hypothetical protein [Canibacter zhuwentaonis]MBT1018266.1 hypothetical protein [Canibacter zhuwentaonis]MBT1035276.1 hypothetical protein [Canibacter zhuwentaonis]
MKPAIDLLTETAVADLRLFMARQAQFNGAAIWFITRKLGACVARAGLFDPLQNGAAGGVADGRAKLAVIAPVFAPQSLLQRIPTVLALKTFEISQQSAAVNETYETGAISERLARLARGCAGQNQGSDAQHSGECNTELVLPPAPLPVAWAGITPPFRGWQQTGIVAAASLLTVAREGSAQVARLLPEQPGSAITEKIRAQVWGAQVLPGVPAGAAFALTAMGFLSDTAADAVVTLYSAPGWVRLQTESGAVLIRNNAL